MEPTLPLLILVIPLFMFLFLGLVGGYMKPKVAGVIGTPGMGTTLVLAFITAYTYFIFTLLP